MAAFGELYEAYRPVVYSIAKRKLGNHEHAEDMVHAVFVRTFDALQRGNWKDCGIAFGAFLHTVTSNMCADFWKKKENQVVIPLEGFEVQGRSVDQWLQPYASNNVKDWMEDNEIGDIAALVRALVATLPADQRLAVELFHLQGHSIREVGALLTPPRNESATKALLFRARAALLRNQETHRCYRRLKGENVKTAALPAPRKATAGDRLPSPMNSRQLDSSAVPGAISGAPKTTRTVRASERIS